MYDPITEFPQAVAWVDNFLANHRIDPYTSDEIKEIMRPLPKPLTLGVNETPEPHIDPKYYSLTMKAFPVPPRQ